SRMLALRQHWTPEGLAFDEKTADDLRLCDAVSVDTRVHGRCAAAFQPIRWLRIQRRAWRSHQARRNHQEPLERGPAGDCPAPDLQVFLVLCPSEQWHGEGKERYGQSGFLLGFYQ